MTDIQLVRLLISDNVPPYHFTDVQIQAFLTIGGSVYLAAALALKSWAASLTATLDSERIGDYAYTSGNAAKKVELADEYIALNNTLGTGGIALDIASMNLTGAADDNTLVVP